MADNDKTVRDAMLDTVLNQLETGDPAEAKSTYDRLVAAGQSKNQALQLMAAALRVEMNRMLSESTPFDNQRYAALLAKINPA
jgi:Tfp pilus assembly protein PilF